MSADSGLQAGAAVRCIPESQEFVHALCTNAAATAVLWSGLESAAMWNHQKRIARGLLSLWDAPYPAEKLVNARGGGKQPFSLPRPAPCGEVGKSTGGGQPLSLITSADGPLARPETMKASPAPGDLVSHHGGEQLIGPLPKLFFKYITKDELVPDLHDDSSLKEKRSKSVPRKDTDLDR